MSRGRDDDRDLTPEREPEPVIHARVEEVPARGLTLPRGDVREPVEGRDRDYFLNGADVRALATVGAFRVVPTEDLETGGAGPALWRHLADEGLVTLETIVDRDGAQHVAALTREGKDLLDTHSMPRAGGHEQEYYAGIVKPRELRHDAQLYRVFQAEAARIEREGGRVTRVILDYELKRDYQIFLNRKHRPDDTDLRHDRQAFAKSHELPIVRGHLELPDLRIEYETESGRLEHRDVELVTEHYSRGQLSGKSQAGFARYRGSASGGRGGNTRRGGTPHDPKHLERL
ncbi:MAG: hypothetical protein ABI634_07280 [Acidobacteriota bacterium]